MEFLDEMIAKRLASLTTDIIADEFPDQVLFTVEITRLVDVMASIAVFKGIDRDVAKSYLEKNFAEEAKKLYVAGQKTLMEKAPDDYRLKEKQLEIEALINNGDIEQADKKLDEVLATFEDPEMCDELIKEGVFSKEDIDYFKNVACPHFQALKASVIPPEESGMNFFQRIAKAVSFIITGKNPYDNKNVKIKNEKVSFKERIRDNKLVKWVNGHRVIATLTAATISLGAICVSSRNSLHKLDDRESLTVEIPNDEEFKNIIENAEIAIKKVQNEKAQSDVEMATFEVDQFHNFNINDQVTHTKSLQLLARAVMVRGVPVVSEEESMKLELEDKLGCSAKELNNWLMCINLADIDDLTFTKLLENSGTTKEELSSDFMRVSDILGAIYTTKENKPFIYQFISNKTDSEYIRTYEEAIIQNQKGNPNDLISLIKSRVNTLPSASRGALGILSTTLVYQQANVYNPQVVGQDAMDLYNINGDCTTSNTKACFYSEDWAEYMRTLNQKLDATISYTGSEATAYRNYLSTLTVVQNGNKVCIESTVLPYLKENGIELGAWDVLENIKNDTTEVISQGPIENSGVVSTPVETRKTVPKAPTTPEEKKVQAQVEADLAEENREAFEEAISQGNVQENENGDYNLYIPDQSPIFIDADTMGTYDPSKDYKGPIYDGYDAYKDIYHEQIKEVEGVGNVVVTDEGKWDIKISDVYIDGNGDLIDKESEKLVTGTEEDMDEVLNRQPGLSEWITTEEGDIHYSDVDNDLPNATEPPTNNPGNANETEQKPIVNIPEKSDPVLGEVDQNILDILTPEEQLALEEMLNAGKQPEAGEIVDETYESIEPQNGNIGIQSGEPEIGMQSGIATQIVALEEMRAGLIGEEVQIEGPQKVL